MADEVKAEIKDTNDYSHFKDIDESDYKGIDEFLGERKVNDFNVRYKIAERTNDMKKYQRLADSRLTEIKSKGPDEVKKEFDGFLNDLRTDPIGGFTKYKDKYNLPDAGFVQKMAQSGGDIATRVGEWQEKSLIPSIEKKHKIDNGTFVYDAAEAYKPGTPSYQYRVETEKQERTFTNEFNQKVQKETDSFNKAMEFRKGDLKTLQDTFFKPSSDKEEDIKKANDEFAETVSKLDAMWVEMSKGDLSAKSNPLALYNVFRGVFFDQLVGKVVEQKINEVHAQYQKYKMYLPEKEMPTDVTKMNGSLGTGGNGNDPRRAFSPMHRSLNYK